MWKSIIRKSLRWFTISQFMYITYYIHSYNYVCIQSVFFFNEDKLKHIYTRYRSCIKCRFFSFLDFLWKKKFYLQWSTRQAALMRAEDNFRNKLSSWIWQIQIVLFNCPIVFVLFHLIVNIFTLLKSFTIVKILIFKERKIYAIIY